MFACAFSYCTEQVCAGSPPGKAFKSRQACFLRPYIFHFTQKDHRGPLSHSLSLNKRKPYTLVLWCTSCRIKEAEGLIFMTKTQRSPDRKSTVSSATWKSISQPQANNQAGQVRAWRAGIVLSVRISWAVAVFYKFYLFWWQWVKSWRRQKKEALEKNQAQTIVTFSRCGSSVWRSSAAVVWGRPVCESMDSQRHLEESWTTASNICPPRPPLPLPRFSFHSFFCSF